MATAYNKDDLDMTVSLLVGHLELLQKQVSANDITAANRTLCRMESECANSIHMTRQMIIDDQQALNIKRITQSGDY
jgi:hypothetical protein